MVDFYDFVESADGAAIVMQWVEGVSLRRVLAAQGPAGPLAALSVLGGVLLGLAAAHERGVVHGALRPANILLDADGNAQLTDFATAPAATEVRFGAQYAAPELWDGEPATAATDVYAATAIFYEALTVPARVRGRNMARLHREAPIPADEVPGPLRALVHQGLAKEPQERPKSAADFLGALEDAAVSAYGPSWEAQGRGLPPSSPRRPRCSPSRRSRSRPAAAAATRSSASSPAARPGCAGSPWPPPSWSSPEAARAR